MMRVIAPLALFIHGATGFAAPSPRTISSRLPRAANPFSDFLNARGGQFLKMDGRGKDGAVEGPPAILLCGFSVELTEVQSMVA